MNLDDKIKVRFEELYKEMNMVDRAPDIGIVDPESWGMWASSVLNLFEIALSNDNTYYRTFKALYEKYDHYEKDLNTAKGIFIAAKRDYEAGFMVSIRKEITGEILGDFISLAKSSLPVSKNVASVLASAALEDALKRFAISNGMEVNDKDMTTIKNWLKSEGLVSGAQKSLLDVMPKLRNHAMHGEWDKLTKEDVSSVIGFVEQFVLNNY